MPLASSSVIKGYLADLYYEKTQYDAPPSYPVNRICNGIDSAPQGTDVLKRIFAGVESVKNGKIDCLDVSDNTPTDERLGWSWQVCYVTHISISNKCNYSFYFYSQLTWVFAYMSALINC